MINQIPPVKRYMTTSPHTIGQNQSLAQAHKLLQAHHIRHLPVLHGGALVGILSDRDLHIIETLRDVDAEKVTVEEAMTSAVYTTSPDAPLDEVVDEMTRHKYGSAVIMDHGKVIGVFTTIDALSALSEILRTHVRR